MKKRLVILHFIVATQAEANEISIPEIDGFIFVHYVTVNNLIEPFVKVVYDSGMITERDEVNCNDGAATRLFTQMRDTNFYASKNTISINSLLNNREDVSSFRTHGGERVYITDYNSETHRMLKKSINNG